MDPVHHRSRQDPAIQSSIFIGFRLCVCVLTLILASGQCSAAKLKKKLKDANNLYLNHWKGILSIQKVFKVDKDKKGSMRRKLHY